MDIIMGDKYSNEFQSKKEIIKALKSIIRSIEGGFDGGSEPSWRIENIDWNQRYCLKNKQLQASKEQIEEWEIIIDLTIRSLNQVPNQVVGHDGEDKPISLFDIIEDLQMMSNDLGSYSIDPIVNPF